MRGAWEWIRRRVSGDRAIAWPLMAAVTLFVHWQMFPSRIFSNTTPAFADLTAHFSTAWYLQRRLLPRGRIAGWSMRTFTGAPVLTFYFPLGSLLIAVLGWLLPLNIAFKLVATMGPLTLPLAAYAFGRLNERDRITSACLAVAVLPMLLEPLLYVSGGSIVSAASSGEYAYGLALSVGLVAVGLAGKGLRTGRHRAAVAALLAAALVSHILPAAVAFLGVVVLTLLHPAWARVRWAVSVVLGAVALAGVWLVPFVSQNRFTGGGDCAKVGPTLLWLFPIGIVPLAVVAACGLVVAVLSWGAGVGDRDRFPAFLACMALVSGIVFAALPASQVCNFRFLPFWYLWVCLLAGYSLAKLGAYIDVRRRAAARGRPLASPTLATMVVPIILFALVPVAWGSRVWAGLLLPSQHRTTALPEKVLGGYEATPERDAYAAFRGMIDRVAREHGCGRVFWEFARSGRLAHPALMMHISYLTDGCLSVVDGLYTESSATSRFIDDTNELLSADTVDVPRLTADLHLFGARYLLAVSAPTQADADRSSHLRLIAEVPRGSDGVWKMYELAAKPQVVEPLPHTPVVVPQSGRSRLSWQRTADDWYVDDSRDVVLAADGPAEWPRQTGADPVPRLPLPPTAVTDVRISDERISFRVSEPGTPVLVKVSYFPNWRVEGARGPWRVTPNQMVVIPTERNVTFRYGRSTSEGVGALVSLAGLAGVIMMARRPLTMPEKPKPVDDNPRPKARHQTGNRPQSRKKSRRRSG